MIALKMQVRFVFWCLSLVAILAISEKTSSGTKVGNYSLTLNQIQVLVTQHNDIRREANPWLPPLQWNPDLVSTAMHHSDRCEYRQSTEAEGRNGAGELMWGGTHKPDPGKIVHNWYREKAACGCDRNVNRCCTSYAQMIWHSVTSFGCGVTQCRSIPNREGWRYIFVCHYSTQALVSVHGSVQAWPDTTTTTTTTTRRPRRRLPVPGQFFINRMMPNSMFQQMLIDDHNTFRRKAVRDFHATNMLKMYWDPILAQTAQRHADRCQFGHSKIGARVNGRGGKFGENIWAGSVLNITDVVWRWYEEINIPRCCSLDHTFTFCCGHHTQVVWSSSNRVGCGVSHCTAMRDKLDERWKFSIVCHYSPQGNLIRNMEYVRAFKWNSLAAPCSTCRGGGVMCEDGLCTSPSLEGF